MSVAEWDDTYGIHHWQILWSSYGKLPWVGFEPATTEPSSNALTDWGMRPCVQLSLKVNFLMPLEFYHLLSVTFPFNFYSHSNFIICSVSHFISAVYLHQSSRLFSVRNHMSVAEWAHIYGFHHWRIPWSSYRKLAWVGFDPGITEPLSHALTNWAIKTWIQLLFRPIFVQPSQFRHLFSVIFHFGRWASSVVPFG